MLKLVRLALTAAVLTAIALRLRRRARMPAEPLPPPQAPPRRSAGTGIGLMWAAIAAIVAVALGIAVVPTEFQKAEEVRYRAYQAEQAAFAAEMDAATDAPATTPVAPTATPVPTYGSEVPVRVSTTPGVTASGVPDPGVTASGVPAPSTTGLPAACMPRGPVRVRPIRPEVRAAVNRQWRRIERWLRANAPGTYAGLAAPGRARTIAVAEAQMGLEFPDDLRASLLRHNGVSGPLPARFTLAGEEPSGVREIRDRWRQDCAARVSHGDPAGRLIHVGTLTEVDADTGHVVASAVRPDPIWPSYHAMLRDVADALEEGRPVLGARPTVEQGLLHWSGTPVVSGTPGDPAKS
ncbi:hypothetical protein FH608_024845 [Nonomuraea phyllanthi]|uniref:Knr4/Smi1-like domain-containing protein n=1 Tax=Nonomuraea phyllanthi TaxID=2219224 RepID=A0A5C4W9Y1_9ACTN|nr:hypothetical protein [Nonomuraea phyllanthi]KAB8192710.1 hypothetical protein FH608_024845 [Nonomuraea phyllanthi]